MPIRPQVPGGGSGAKGSKGSTERPMTTATSMRVVSTSPPRFTMTLVIATVSAETRHSRTGSNSGLIRAVLSQELQLGEAASGFDTPCP